MFGVQVDIAQSGREEWREWEESEDWKGEGGGREWEESEDWKGRKEGESGRRLRIGKGGRKEKVGGE